MAVNKRKTLRSRIAGKNVRRTAGQDVDSSVRSVVELQNGTNDYLRQKDETKKEKAMKKHDLFISKVTQTNIQNGYVNTEGLSKSSIRRRKRKLREELKPKMANFLDPLKEDKDLVGVIEGDGNMNIDTDGNMDHKHDAAETAASKEVQRNMNKPSIRTQKGSVAILKQEGNRFNKVLNTEEFKTNPFTSLRDIIRMREGTNI